MAEGQGAAGDLPSGLHAWGAMRTWPHGVPGPGTVDRDVEDRAIAAMMRTTGLREPLGALLRHGGRVEVEARRIAVVRARAQDGEQRAKAEEALRRLEEVRRAQAGQRAARQRRQGRRTRARTIRRRQGRRG